MLNIALSKHRDRRLILAHLLLFNYASPCGRSLFIAYKYEEKHEILRQSVRQKIVYRVQI
jgi:hypothetical protein